MTKTGEPIENEEKRKELLKEAGLSITKKGIVRRNPHAIKTNRRSSKKKTLP
jgi:hypothetical protein